jgi:suppressor for copper-sensitivity B
MTYSIRNTIGQGLRAAVLIAMAWLMPAVSATAATSESYVSTPISARLITAEDAVATGARLISAGLELTLSKGWKTYWRSPGEVGYPPSVDWAGSGNIADVEFLWPAPERFKAFGIENFGYKDTVVFPLLVTLENPGEPATLSGSVNLLVCSLVCTPHDFELNLSLDQGTGIDADAARLISTFAARVPDDGSASGLSVETATLDADLTSLIVTARSATGFQSPDIFPELGAGTAFGAPDIRLGDGGKLMWAKLPILAAGETLPELSVTLTDGALAATFQPGLSDVAPAPPFALDRIVPGVNELAWIALIAVLGGLILNIMPCVLPVLSIKMSSALKISGQSHARIRGGFLMTALGVLSFMWLLAGATLLARQLGLSVGWGLQFQNPVFLVVMILILTIFAANFFGLFEISLPQSWQAKLSRADGSASSAGGYTGDFATGAFAAVLATPCSAPFLGTAVAFALAGRPVDIFVIFTALGIGLALPYLLIAAAPGLVKKLPKPGKWMVWFKLVLGSLLALTAAWLFWVLQGVGGSTAMLVVAAGAALVILLLSRLLPLPGRLKALSLASLVAATLLTPLFLKPDTSASAKVLTEWATFDRSAIARLVSEGQVVFVDITADWCLTCKANKALVLEREPVATALAAEGVTPMQADWTRPDESISRYLASFGRYGIPFNAVYGPGAPNGITLPEILNAEAVLDALAAATQQTTALAN